MSNKNKASIIEATSNSAYYILGGIYIIVINAALIPEIFMLIIDSAFNTTAASGGLEGGSGSFRYQTKVASL